MYPPTFLRTVPAVLVALLMFGVTVYPTAAQPSGSVQPAAALDNGLSNRPQMVHLHATPGTYDGPCPGTITFSGKIFGDRGDTVIVQWNRSDSATTDPDTLVLDQHGKARISTTWTLGSDSLSEYEGWQSVTVTYPDGSEVTSDQAEFRVKCGEEDDDADDDDEEVEVEVEVSPEKYEGDCPGVFTFTATISGPAGDTLTGMWERSDSAIAPEFEIVLDSTGSATTATTWTLGGSGLSEYEGWQRLKITLADSTVITSDEAEFELDCADSTEEESEHEAHIALRATPGAHVGPCPGVITFTAKIFGTPGDTVTYQWNRSDSAIAPVETVALDADGKADVTTTWTLGGGSLTEYEGWQSLTVTYPDGTEITSREAGFKLKCRERGNSREARSNNPVIE